VNEQQAVFARFRYPARGGFFRFFERLYDDVNVSCGERAVELDTQRRQVRFSSGRVEPYAAVASSIPLPELVRITPSAPAELRDAASRLRHTQLLCVNVIVRRPDLTDAPWFYIYDHAIDAARVSVPTNLVPGAMLGRTALQAEVFRRHDEPLPIDALTNRVVSQLGAMLHFSMNEVLAVQPVAVPRAYVISDHQRAGAVTAIRDWFANQDVFTMGLYGRWRYVWSDEAFRQGRETAAVVRTHLGVRRAG
jgi:protoporphyrinogen oxidase